MSYLQKICKNSKENLVSLPSRPSMAIPHQSFTPREILAQFVRNDVQVQRLQPTDEVDTLDAMSFEDDFEARQFIRNEMPEILEQRKQLQHSNQQEVTDSDTVEQQQNQTSNVQSSSELQSLQKPQQSEQQPVKVEAV